MTFYHTLIRSTIIPWRLRNCLETWIESQCYVHYPALYRWLHFRNPSQLVQAVTRGPKHHFFGYYDKCPWNASGRYLLAHESNFNDRPPSSNDSVVIGIIDQLDGNRFLPLAETLAWNWQQGAMLQWHPADLEHLWVHNDRRNGKFIGVVRDLNGSEMRFYERPIYALSPDGKTAFSLNFARLAYHRPGYGYAGGDDPFANEYAPEQDGIWQIDLNTGKSKLIVSIAQLASLNPKPSMQAAWHYINHIQPSRKGKRIAFFHVWHRNERQWEVRLYTCKPNGEDLRCLLDTGFVSHYDWRDDDTILVWSNRPGSPPRFLLINHTGSQRAFAEASLTEDGHCSFSPDGQWVLNDTYPDSYQKRTLMLIHFITEKRIDIARLSSPKSRWWGEIRCDLHPRWNRRGNIVCIDSVHEGSRQMYTIDVSKWTQ
jgi:hypothetical protein